MQHGGEVVHWVLIKVCLKYGGDKVEFIKWSDLPFPVRYKWDWYFKYRAALLQVKYPKYYVEIRWGNAEPQGIQAVNILKNKMRAKKAKVTEYSNKIARAVENWSELFPIDEEPIYKKTVEKLNRLKSELQELEKIKP